MKNVIKQAMKSPNVDAKLLRESLDAFKCLQRSGGTSIKGYGLSEPFSIRPLVKAEGVAGQSDPRLRLIRAVR